jgi:choline-sulfatase
MILLLLSCRDSRPDVLLVTLDTTRADRIGAYGASDAQTPALDTLASEGTRYSSAWSPVPLTIPAHASLMTGRWPSHHGIRANGDATLSPSLPTLASHLHAHGWSTAASVGAYVTSSVWGFDRGFDTFFEPGEAGSFTEERPAREVVEDALRWEQDTRGEPEPRFLWVHLFDPHLPNPPSQDRDPYDVAITEVDSAIASLVAAFDRRPTLVVAVADHGEGRGDHGEDAHGWFIYPQTQQVPLIVRGPGVARGEVQDAPTSLVDVAPTMLALLGLPALPGADGQAEPPPERGLYLESWQLAQRFGLAAPQGLLQGELLLVDLPRPELYALSSDPGAQRDLAASRPEQVRALQALLSAMDLLPPGPSSVDPDLSAQLMTLGYLAPSEPSGSSGEDPKDWAGWLARSQEVDQLVLQERLAEAEALLGTLDQERPGLADLASRRAWLLLRLGRLPEAVAVLQEALARPEAPVTLQVALGTTLAMSGRFSEAADAYLVAAQRSPGSAGPRTLALRALLDAGEPVRATEHGADFVRQLPEELALAGLYGLALVRAGRVAEAVPWLERGAAAAVPERGVLYHLSALAAGRGDRDSAIELLDRELALYPAHGEALLARCRFHAAAGEPAQAEALAARALALRPEDPAAQACLALIRRG